MPRETLTTSNTPPPRNNYETLLSTVSRLSHDRNAGDEHHLASLAILSRITTASTMPTLMNGTGGGKDVGGTASSPSPPDPREVEEALGPDGLNFLTRLVSTYVASVRSRGEEEERRGRELGSSTTKGNPSLDERMEDARTGSGGAGARLADADGYLSLAVSVASYLASESPSASRDVDGERCRGDLPAILNARLMSRLIDALLIRAELHLTFEDVDGRILSVFTGAALHLVAAVEEAGARTEGEEVVVLLPRCAEAAVTRFRRATSDRCGDVNGEGVGGARRRAYCEGLASFLRSLLILGRKRRGLTPRSPDDSSSSPPLLVPTSTLVDLLEMTSGGASRYCCVDLHEMSLLWTTETLTHELVAADGRRAGDEGPSLMDLLRGADRRASTALRRSILLGTMGMTVKSNHPTPKEEELRLTTTDDDGRRDDASAAAVAVRLRNASYAALVVAMESCGGRWLLDLDHSDPSSVANGGGGDRGTTSVGMSLTALVRMVCGELRIILEGAATASTSSTSPSPSSSSSSVRASSRSGGGGREGEGSLEQLEVASHCVRAIVSTVGLLVKVSSAMEEDDEEGDRGEDPTSSTTASPRPKADWEELLASHGGINSLLEIRCSLNGALGACLTYLASTMPTPTPTQPLRSGHEVEGGEGRNTSRIHDELGEERSRHLLGLLCSHCVGALLAETEVHEVVAAVEAAAAASSSSSDAGGGEGCGGAASVVADALRNAVILCDERGRGLDEVVGLLPSAVVAVGGGTTSTEREDEEPAESAAETSASSTVVAEAEPEPLTLLLPALAKMLAPDGDDGDDDAGTSGRSLASPSPSSLVVERLARERVVVDCVASNVRRVSSSLRPPDGDEVADDAMDTDMGAEDSGGCNDVAAKSDEGCPHTGLRWALLVMERWWWWYRRTSTCSTSSRAGYDDDGDGEETALPLPLLGAVVACAGALTDRVRMRALAQARRAAEGAMVGEEAAASEDGNDVFAGEKEEREDRISLCVALQTWFSIWGEDDDAENGTIRLDGPTEVSGVIRHRGFDDRTLLAVVARAMITTFAVPVPCTDAKPYEEALALEVARTAATVTSSVSGRSGFDRIVWLSGLDGASIESLRRAVGWWSHRIRE